VARVIRNPQGGAILIAPGSDPAHLIGPQVLLDRGGIAIYVPKISWIKIEGSRRQAVSSTLDGAFDRGLSH
jgi:hypothetical protein